VGAIPEVVAHHARRDRLEQRVAGEGRLPLHLAEVGSASHAHIAVAPLLLADPLQGVVAVVRLVIPGHEFSLGVVSAAHVLGDIDIAILRPVETKIHEEVVVVRGARQQDWPGSIPPGGEIDIRRQVHSVPHGNRLIVLHADIGRAKNGHGISFGYWPPLPVTVSSHALDTPTP
jgi:hypothetical protein